MTVQQSFLAVLNAVTTVNDRWPAVISNADLMYLLDVNGTDLQNFPIAMSWNH